jgi:adenosylhomocysteine nucleosidase
MTKTEKIGIIGAMDEEIAELKKRLITGSEKIKTINAANAAKTAKITAGKIIAGNVFYEGTLFGRECVIVKSGVGKVYAAMTAQILISKFAVDKIIFTGLAGSINKSIKIGDIVIGETCVQYDLDASELGFKVGQVPYTALRFFAGDKKMLQAALKTKMTDEMTEINREKSGTKIVKGTILTGDLFLNHKAQDKYKEIFKELNGDCLEMEGAAVAQVCTLNKVPFCLIRIISDNADENALDDFEKFKNVVSKKSLKIIENIIAEK